MFTFAFNIRSVKAGTITVPDDFTTIQEAINNASEGDTILVRSGTYSEHLVVNKTVSLIGENRNITILNGTTYNDPIMTIEARNVKISNFTFEGYSFDIIVNAATGATIVENTIIFNAIGIDVENSMNTTIENNVINGSGLDNIGIMLAYSSKNSVVNNTITNAIYDGIRLWRSNNNVLRDNNITSNDYGIYFHESSKNNVSDNTISENNNSGIYLESDSSSNRIFHNNFIDNYKQVGFWYSIPANIWDDGYPSGGNYWSNYTGVDQKSGPYQNVTGSDGIGDTPYIIVSNNQDRYPLMHRWSSLPVHNINTGFGYSTIQGAIDDSQTLNGHTIFVDESIYYENIVISKAITLVGANQESTIIDGKGNGVVVLIAANNVHLTNMNIKNRNFGIGISGSSTANVSVENFTINNVGTGIWFDLSSSVSISHNTVSNATVMGIVGYASSNVTIENNLVYTAGLVGIHLDGNSIENKIVNNTVTNSLEGIEIEKSAGNFVEGNRLVNNNASLVINQSSGLNVFRQNNMTSRWYNLIVWGLSLTAFNQDIDSSNTANNKTIYYLTNLHNHTINPFNYPNMGYLALINSTNVKIENIDLSYNRDGLLVAQTTNSSLANVTLSGNRGPLLYGGLTFFESNNNRVVNSLINNNSAGMCFYQSNGNTLYHNSFINNTIQVISNFYAPFSPPSGTLSANTWDNGFEGNYWSNYTGAYNLTTGIGLTPHIIDGSNQDNYPLMAPYITGDYNHDGTVNMTDVEMVRAAWQLRTGELNYNPHLDFNMDGIINIRDVTPLALNWLKHF